MFRQDRGKIVLPAAKIPAGTGLFRRFLPHRIFSCAACIKSMTGLSQAGKNTFLPRSRPFPVSAPFPCPEASSAMPFSRRKHLRNVRPAHGLSSLTEMFRENMLRQHVLPHALPER